MTPAAITKNTLLIKAEAERLGFLHCGVAKAGFLAEEAPRLERWLNQGFHGSMSYMERNFDKRLDPRLLVEGTVSVLSLSYNYYSEDKTPEDGFKVARYAYGTDYHLVVKDKLKELLRFIELNIGAVSGRAFVDSAPVLEKAWATRAGLGWIGKNGNLLSKKKGSYFFLAELLLDLPLDVDPPSGDFQHCGTCRACLDACPTQAIVAPAVVDAQKCIAHATIELKDKIPDTLQGQMDNWIFGCDVCQEVCPWNRFSLQHNDQRLAPRPYVSYSADQWKDLTHEVFKELFKDTPFERAKYSGLMRNIEFVQKND